MKEIAYVVTMDAFDKNGQSVRHAYVSCYDPTFNKVQAEEERKVITNKFFEIYKKTINNVKVYQNGSENYLIYPNNSNWIPILRFTTMPIYMNAKVQVNEGKIEASSKKASQEQKQQIIKLKKQVQRYLSGMIAEDCNCEMFNN